MKVYEVAWMNGEDNTLSKFFTTKKDANRFFNSLEKERYTPESFEDETDVLMVHDVYEFEVEITKSGIMSMLNSKFSE